MRLHDLWKGLGHCSYVTGGYRPMESCGLVPGAWCPGAWQNAYHLLQGYPLQVHRGFKPVLDQGPGCFSGSYTHTHTHHTNTHTQTHTIYHTHTYTHTPYTPFSPSPSLSDIYLLKSDEALESLHLQRVFQSQHEALYFCHSPKPSSSGNSRLGNTPTSTKSGWAATHGVVASS